MRKEHQRRYDAILIPGGGVTKEGKVPAWVKERLDGALAVQNGEYLIPLSGMTIHKRPPLDEEGFPLYDSHAAAHYLAKQGIKKSKILPENASRDTIGDAYFSRVIHIMPRGFRKLLVITSEFHMPRVRAVFRKVYSLDAKKREYSLTFKAVPDRGIGKKALQMREEKEKRSLRRFQKLAKTIRTLEDLHTFLYSRHDAYRVGKRPKKERGYVLDTY